MLMLSIKMHQVQAKEVEVSNQVCWCANASVALSRARQCSAVLSCGRLVGCTPLCSTVLGCTRLYSAVLGCTRLVGCTRRCSAVLRRSAVLGCARPCEIPRPSHTMIILGTRELGLVKDTPGWTSPISSCAGPPLDKSRLIRCPSENRNYV